jgi:hypothetical protein
MLQRNLFGLPILTSSVQKESFSYQPPRSIIPYDGGINWDAKTHLLFPAIKVGEPRTYGPVISGLSNGNVICIKDLIRPSGLTPRPVLGAILNKGLYGYFHSERDFVLSSIMHDKTINGFKVEGHEWLIKELKPKYFITPDAGTYESEKNTTEALLDYLLDATARLKRNCPHSEPLGLVKGYTKDQVARHSRALTDMGVTRQVFDIGDFMHKGNRFSKNTAFELAREIRRNADYLLIYGLGSGPQFERFLFADGFITSSHWIAAFNYKKIVNGRSRPTVRPRTLDAVSQNFLDLKSHLAKLDANTILNG